MVDSFPYSDLGESGFRAPRVVVVVGFEAEKSVIWRGWDEGEWRGEDGRLVDGGGERYDPSWVRGREGKTQDLGRAEAFGAGSAISRGRGRGAREN
ncbi:hypothetical protein M5K25_019345 [Dendrobium thyrsiflorum]|uniref:Uncharacterized protein n=1 Tax=Dendrobium thyrsiflorum TaxID=117978 RepID=A0ABD0UEP8_DENTH